MGAAFLFLTRDVFDGIIAHAREGKPKEVCGILRGRGDRAFKLVRGRNVAQDPFKDYVIDSQTLLLQFDFEEEGDEMVAVYHSHPVSPAYPSASDAWSAFYPECAYLICSLEDGERPVLRAFRMVPFDIVLEIARLRATLDFDETRPGRFGYYQPLDVPLPPVLQDSCTQVPTPFYIVFESAHQSGKKTTSRVVSIFEVEIQIEDV